jgi:hypothetical protein
MSTEATRADFPLRDMLRQCEKAIDLMPFISIGAYVPKGFSRQVIAQSGCQPVVRRRCNPSSLALFPLLQEILDLSGFLYTATVFRNGSCLSESFCPSN